MLLCFLASGILVAKRLHCFGRRADELDLAIPAHLGEVRVLGEKAEARVDCLNIGDLGGADDARDLQITFARRRGSDADRLIGQLEIRGAAISLTVDGNGLNAEIAARANDAQGDLATVGH